MTDLQMFVKEIKDKLNERTSWGRNQIIALIDEIYLKLLESKFKD